MDRRPQRAATREPRESRQRTAPQLREIEVPEMITVANLAELLKVSPINLMKQLMRAGVMASLNEVIDYNTAAAIIPAFGYQATPEEDETRSSREDLGAEEEEGALESRSPVVAVLGHVDHGKTTLLDAIRKTKVAEREAGGITQHIGAYQIEYNGQKITFLDTPGHEAFTAMRARGADVTDIAVLVVAADDGIMPQTVEAINHVKDAGVPIVVAINKMDRPDADPDRVKRQLAEQGLLIEEWGGEVVAVPLSAREGTGIDDLLENILVVAEVSDLKANPDRPARGVVVESKLDRSRGPAATVLVKTGTLHTGDHMVVRTVRGRIKALISDAGRRIKSAGPSVPVEVLGLSALPEAGDTFSIVDSERQARATVEARLRKQEGVRRHASLEDVVSRIRTGETKELNLIIKADVQGSVEAVRDAVSRLSTEQAQVRIVHMGSGSITETDMFLAVASEAIVIGFNTSMQPGARRVAETEGVEVRFYSVIYTLVEEIQNILKGLVEPTTRDIVEGYAEVRAVFARARRSKVAGCLVTDGRAVRNGLARVRRGNQLLHDGPVQSLRHYNSDVREVTAGSECGVVIRDFDDFQEGDVIEIHRQEQVRI